ncbi:MAG: hypothetical protein KC777_16125 [Cyanobacteria bacterium HKST-UBA02]|nr:hypothetical protein [Cyanobacteria bacterium HKST-UBA02]
MSSSFLKAIALLACLLSLQCLAPAPAAPGAGSKGHVFVIKQLQEKTGQHTICMSKDGFKLICGELALVSTAPDWGVTIFNRRAKKCFKTSLDKLANDWIESLPGGAMTPAPKGPEDEKTIAGHKTGHFQIKDGARPAIDVWLTHDIPMDPNVIKLVRHLYGNDSIDGLPLLASGPNKNGKTIDYLTTQWCQERELSDSFYGVPASCKPTDKLEEVEHPKNLSPERVRRFKPFANKKINRP